MDIKFLTQENEIQKLYSKFGLVVPVGDLSTCKAPAVQPLSTESTQTSVTAKFNVMSGADITALSYTVNDGEAVSVTPTKGVITITLTDLDYNSGPYEIVITAVNENGSTSAKADVALQHYTDWAEPESVLAGNRFVVEGEEEVGTIPTKTASDVTVGAGQESVTIPAGYYAEETQVRVYPEPDYFTIEALYDEVNGRYIAEFYIQNWGTNLSYLPRFYYSFDKVNWTLYPNDGSVIQISGEGAKVYIYGDNATRFSSSSSNYTNIVLGSAGAAKVYGDILTLMTPNVSIVKSLPDSCFYKLFINSPCLVDASGLILPSFISSRCYERMFYGCTSLVNAPTLPATTLADFCYSYMFDGCTSLTQAPALPATTLPQSCYAHMFDGCTSLTQAPALPATTLAQSCCEYMFNGCTSLTQAPSTLPATTLAQSCYNYMFSGCTSLVNAPAMPATTLASSCYNYMFNGCTSLTSFSGLPATDINTTCYQNMFKGCTGLTEAEITGEISSITAPGFTAMFDGCSSLAKITLHATTWATNRATNWVRGVAATGDFYNLGGATIATGTNGIPSGWTEHTTIE